MGVVYEVFVCVYGYVCVGNSDGKVSIDISRLVSSNWQSENIMSWRVGTRYQNALVFLGSTTPEGMAQGRQLK